MTTHGIFKTVQQPRWLFWVFFPTTNKTAAHTALNPVRLKHDLADTKFLTFPCCQDDNNVFKCLKSSMKYTLKTTMCYFVTGVIIDQVQASTYKFTEPHEQPKWFVSSVSFLVRTDIFVYLATGDSCGAVFSKSKHHCCHLFVSAKGKLTFYGVM